MWSARGTWWPSQSRLTASPWDSPTGAAWRSEESVAPRSVRSGIERRRRGCARLASRIQNRRAPRRRDYVTKPFGIEELFARVRAVSRRMTAQAAPIVRLGEWVVDLPAHRLLPASSRDTANNTVRPNGG